MFRFDELDTCKLESILNQYRDHKILHARANFSERSSFWILRFSIFNHNILAIYIISIIDSVRQNWTSKIKLIYEMQICLN